MVGRAGIAGPSFSSLLETSAAAGSAPGPNIQFTKGVWFS